MFELGFLEIRHDPQIIDRNDFEQRSARCDKPADADLAIADNAVDRCTYHRAGEIDLGEIEQGLRLGDGGNGSFALSGKDGDAFLLHVHRCRRRYACIRSRSRRVAFIDFGLADEAAAEKFATAVGGFGRQIQLGHVGAPPGLGLPNQGVLKSYLRIDIGHASLCSFDIGDGLREPCAIVPIVDPEQDVARPNGLVVRHFYYRDVTGNLGRERGRVAADIGVVGRCLAARTRPGPSRSATNTAPKPRSTPTIFFLSSCTMMSTRDCGSKPI